MTAPGASQRRFKETGGEFTQLDDKTALRSNLTGSGRIKGELMTINLTTEELQALLAMINHCRTECADELQEVPEQEATQEVRSYYQEESRKADSLHSKLLKQYLYGEDQQ